MKLYFRSRRLLFNLCFIVAFEVACTFLALAIRMPNEAVVIEAGITVPLQIIPVWVAATSLRSSMEEFEIASSRSVLTLRGVTWTVLTCTLLIGALIHCLLSFSHWGERHSGSVGLFGAFRAALGMWGATLLVSTFVDPRLAAVVCFIPISMGLLTDPTAGNAQFLGFVLASEHSTEAWAVAWLLFVIGSASYILGYDYVRRREHKSVMKLT